MPDADNRTPDERKPQQVSDECIGGECEAPWCRTCFIGCIHNGVCIDCGAPNQSDSEVGDDA